MNVSRITAALVASTSLVLVSPALAQLDPEAGDTGEWTPPPAEQPSEQPPAEQQQPAEPPPAQQPPPANNNWQQAPAEQPSWFNNGEEAPPGVGQPETPVEDEPEATETDHDQVGLGLTFIGVNQLRIEPSGIPGRTGGTPVSIRTATLGIRYWISSTIGLDLGVGFGFTSSQNFDDCRPGPDGNCVEGNEIDGNNGGFALSAHIGLPIALKTFEHFTFLLTPEVAFHYGQAELFEEDVVDPANPDNQLNVDIAAIAIDAGLKVGGELQFGFWGIPNLSVQAHVGLGLRYTTRSGENTASVATGRAYAGSTDELTLRTIADDLAGAFRLTYYFN